MRATAFVTAVQPIQLEPGSKIVRVAFSCDAEASEALLTSLPVGSRVDPRMAKMGELDVLAEVFFRVVQVGHSEAGPWGEPVIVFQDQGPARVIAVERLLNTRQVPPRSDDDEVTLVETPERWRRVSVARFRGVVPGS